MKIIHWCKLGLLIPLLLQLNSDLFAQPRQAGMTWAEKLGFPPSAKVLILHADDIGMCYEANKAAQHYFENRQIQSASVMVPCPWFPEMAEWWKTRPEHDIGLHLALTSEWKTYRWDPVADASTVPGLIDPDGFMWRDVRSVVMHASPEEVAREIRAQLAKARQFGLEPSHIDTHMGTLYAHPEFVRTYLDMAVENNIPAMVIEMTPAPY